MIAGIVFVPSAPLLLAEYTGRDDAGAELRERCVAAIQAAATDGVDEVCVIAADTAGRTPQRGALGFRIGRELLALAGDFDDVAGALVQIDARIAGEIGWLGQDLAERPGRVLILAVGDGSPKRGEKAPGHLDDRSFAVDDAWVGALETADPEAFLALDPDLCAELQVTGRAVWQSVAVAARASGVAWTGHLDWSGDPFGVMYAVGRWTPAVPVSVPSSPSATSHAMICALSSSV